ncbi:flippase [Halorubrum ezzemoulense]|uniref:flippase n=1 Tax=Halorubrum ezzemoulense TaxID=337243 RepID=UPI00232F1DE2|nr:flippase [Halorubrum ezzemoulense]MDB2272462.1 flippase [Halorubrum ezzemoulense]
MALKLARDGVVQLVANVSRAGISFVSLAWFANVVPREELAILFLYQAVLGLASIPASYGLNGAIIKRITENYSQDQIISAGGILTTVGLSIVIMVLFVGQSFINQYLGADLIIWVLMGLIFAEFKKYLVAILRGTGHVPTSALIELLQTTIWAFSAIALIATGGNPVVLIKTLVGSFVLSSFVGILAVMVLIKPTLVIPELKPIKSLLGYAKHNVIAHIDSYSYQWADVAILGIFVTRSSISGYEVAWRLTATLVIISRAIESPLFPLLSQYYTEDRHEEFANTYRKSLLVISGVVLPGVVGIFIFGRQILEIVFGGYQDIFVILVILLIVRVIESIDRVLKTVLSAVDRPDLRAKAVLVSLILNVTLNILLISAFGVIGAAIATTISFSMSTALLFYYVYNPDVKTHLPKPTVSLTFLWIVVSTSCMSVVGFAIGSAQNINTLLELFMAILLTGGAYLIIIILNPKIRQMVLAEVFQ